MADVLSILGLVAGSVAGSAFIYAPPIAKYLRTRTLKTEGLQLLYEERDASIDIICVHGLGGDAKRTWTTETNGKKVNWLTDFLPQQISPARIMTYGYDSDLSNSRYLPQTLNLHSNRLLEQLARKRQGNAETRPIIFIGHSLGGLIVKSTLVQASAAIGEQDNHLKAVQLSTIAVLFFGTPQRETKWKPWSTLLARVTSMTLGIPLYSIPRSIAGETELLLLQLERYKSIEPRIENHCFFEHVKTKRRNDSGADEEVLVIPEDSVVPSPKLGWWHSHQLSRRHEDLVKFGSQDEPDYLVVLNCIKGCREGSEKKAAQNCAAYYDKPGTRAPLRIRAQHNIGVKDPTIINAALRTREHQFDEAEKLYKEGLTKSEDANGLSDPSTLEILRLMARNYSEKGELEKAELVYKRLFVAVQDASNPLSLEVATVLQQMAAVAAEQGHHSEATKSLLQVRRIQETVLKPDHPDTLSTSAQLAILYDLQGRYRDAENIYDDVIKRREDTLGPTHNDTVKVLENLALNYQLQGKLLQARRTYEKVVQRRAENLELELERRAEIVCPELATLKRNAFSKMERPPLERRTEFLHSEIANATKGARAHKDDLQFDQNEDNFQKDISISRLASTVSKLANIHEELGLHEEAQSLLRQWHWLGLEVGREVFEAPLNDPQSAASDWWSKERGRS